MAVGGDGVGPRSLVSSLCTAPRQVITTRRWLLVEAVAFHTRGGDRVVAVARPATSQETARV